MSWFTTLAGLAIKSTAAMGIAWLMARALRGRSAAARHLVWTAAAAAVLALPFLSLTLPILPVPMAGALLPDVSVVFQTAATARADVAISGGTQQSIMSSAAQPAPWRPDWRLSVMLLWAAGAAAALMQMLITCARIWRLRRAAMPSTDGDLSKVLAKGLGISHPVEVLETGQGLMPMTFGILRPAVFMPSDAAAWSDERRRIVLLHELAHVRRGDTATQLLARVALILNWWNPLAWKAWREFLKERERAADDLVLHAGARASDYAGHLLEVARTMRPAPATAWAAIAMARRSQLEGRLIAILDSDVSRQTWGSRAPAAAALCAIALAAPFAAMQAQAPAAPPEVDATIRAASSQKNHEILDRAAAAYEKVSKYDVAQRLLESSLT